MTIHPMISALRKHKAGVVLIALQIALTLAIVCNAVFIIGQRIQRVNRPTGLDEKDMYLVTQQWVGAPTGDDADSIQKLDALQREDLAALRAMPDVQSVTPVNSLPLLNSSWNGSISLNADASLIGGNARTTYYFGDENFVRTLGLRVVAGRDFNAGDVVNKGFRNTTEPSVVMVTKALADKLFPKGGAVGKVVYLDGSGTPSTIIGVVERLQVPSTGSWVSAFTWSATIEPVRLNANFSRYAGRAKPSRRRAAMQPTAPTPTRAPKAGSRVRRARIPFQPSLIETSPSDGLQDAS